MRTLTIALGCAVLVAVGCSDDDTGGDEGGLSQPWRDVDVCSLLSAEALTDVGIPDAEGTAPDNLLPNERACGWGERRRVYVRMAVVEPIGPDPTARLHRYGQVAGRDAYTIQESGWDNRSCDLVIDNDEYQVMITFHRYDGTPVADAGACEAAEALVTAAFSSSPR